MDKYIYDDKNNLWYELQGRLQRRKLFLVMRKKAAGRKNSVAFFRKLRWSRLTFTWLILFVSTDKIYTIRN